MRFRGDNDETSNIHYPRVPALASAQSWTNTGPLITARYGHTSTLLPGGQVLVAGGNGAAGTLASAEVYSPARGVWSAVANLSVARSWAQAVPLLNNRVLVAGGCTSSCSGPTNTAEVFNPAAGKWNPVGSMSSQRYFYSLTVLPNGKVLAAGGCNAGNCNTVTGSAEVYDPATGRWSSTGGLNVPRDYHTATLLTNGKVLVTGGYGYQGAVAASEIYDPVTGQWSGTGSLNAARALHTATLLANGKVLATGGNIGNMPSKSAEVYDPASGQWIITGSLNTSRTNQTATLLANGKVLIAGGTSYSRPNYLKLTTCEWYDPASGTFSLTAPMATGRTEHTATLLANGQVLSAGGISTITYTATSEIFAAQ